MAEENTNERPVGNNELFARELFIALEYLLKYSDKEHPAMGSKIIKYAEENYGVKIERRHLSTVLWSLYSNNKFNELLGIKIDCKESENNKNGEIRRKYYVASRSLDDVDLKNIIGAIKAYSFLDLNNKNELVDELLRINTSKLNKEKIIRELRIQGTDQDVSKLHRIAYRLYKRLAGHISDLVKVKYYDEIKCVTDENGERKLVRDKKSLTGYLYSIKAVDNELFVHILDLRENKVVTLKSRDIINVTTDKIQYEESDLKGLDILKDYSSIDEFLNEYKVIRGGKLIEVNFNVIRGYDIETPFKNRYGQEITRGELITKKDPLYKDKEYTFRHYSYMCDEREAERFLSNPEILKLVYDIEPKYIADRVASKYIRLLRHCDNDEVTHVVDSKFHGEIFNHRRNHNN